MFVERIATRQPDVRRAVGGVGHADHEGAGAHPPDGPRVAGAGLWTACGSADVLEALGVKPISAVGEPFDPHIHEAVVTEATDDYEPDTVMQELVTGFRLGDKLIRPALVKVATRK